MLDILKEQHPLVALISAFGIVLLIYLFSKPGSEIRVIGITFTKREIPFRLPFLHLPSYSFPLDWVRLRFTLHYLIKLGKYSIAFYLIPDFIDNFFGFIWYSDPEDYSISTAIYTGTILLLIAMIKISTAAKDWVINNAHRTAAITFSILASLILCFLMYFYIWPELTLQWRLHQPSGASFLPMLFLNVAVTLVVMVATIGFVFLRRVLPGSFRSVPNGSI